MAGSGQFNVWKMTHTALGLAKGWGTYSPKALGNLQRAVKMCGGNAANITPTEAQGILTVAQDPRAREHFGSTEDTRMAQVAELQELLQPRAQLATRMPGALRTLQSFYGEDDAPKNFAQVIALEAKQRLSHGELADHWLESHMQRWEKQYPLPKDADDSINDARVNAPKRALARLIRLAVLRTASDVTTASKAITTSNLGEYRSLRSAFDASLPVMAKSLKGLFDIIVGTLAAPDNVAQATIGTHVLAAERWEKRHVGKPFTAPDGTVFDHRYIDVLSHITRGADPDTTPSSPTSAEPRGVMTELNLAEVTRNVLSTLTSREERALRMRFAIGEHAPSLEDVGQGFQVSRERIQEIEAKALRKLQNPSPELRGIVADVTKTTEKLKKGPGEK